MTFKYNLPAVLPPDPAWILALLSWTGQFPLSSVSMVTIRVECAALESVAQGFRNVIPLCTQSRTLISTNAIFHISESRMSPHGILK